MPAQFRAAWLVQENDAHKRSTTLIKKLADECSKGRICARALVSGRPKLMDITSSRGHGRPRERLVEVLWRRPSRLPPGLALGSAHFHVERSMGICALTLANFRVRE